MMQEIAPGLKVLVLDEHFDGDFGKCNICGENYQIYGKNGLCDDCHYDLIKKKLENEGINIQDNHHFDVFMYALQDRINRDKM